MLVTDASYSRASLDDYTPLVGGALVEELRVLARPLQGARVLHVNATAVGGGVAEMLLSLIPLMNDVGLAAEWYVLDAEDRFFEVTKGYHNALQCQATEWSRDDFDVYWKAVETNARKLESEFEQYDFVGPPAAGPGIAAGGPGALGDRA